MKKKKKKNNEWTKKKKKKKKKSWMNKKKLFWVEDFRVIYLPSYADHQNVFFSCCQWYLVNVYW